MNRPWRKSDRTEFGWGWYLYDAKDKYIGSIPNKDAADLILKLVNSTEGK